MKIKTKQIVEVVAGKVATIAAGKAKQAGTWRRWLWGIAAAIAAAVAWFTGSSDQQSPADVEPQQEVFQPE